MSKSSSRLFVPNFTMCPKPLHFDPLEQRRLLSAVINVSNYGARPSDSGDDRGAILAAVNASAPGDTILFSGGSFIVSETLNLPSGRTYRGESGAALVGRGGDGAIIDFHVNNVTVTGLTLNGGGIFLDQPAGGKNQNIVIDHNTFRLKRWGEKNNGITF